VSSAPRSTQKRSGWSPMWRNSGPLWPVPSIAISSRGCERRHAGALPAHGRALARARAREAWRRLARGLARPRDQVGRVEPPARESAFEQDRQLRVPSDGPV
jgi:hypothetical protein